MSLFAYVIYGANMSCFLQRQNQKKKSILLSKAVYHNDYNIGKQHFWTPQIE